MSKRIEHDRDEKSLPTRSVLGRLIRRKPAPFHGAERDSPDAGSTPEPSPSSIRELFQFADAVDVPLMLFGSLSAVAHGTLMPLFFVVLGEVTNDFADSKSATPDELDRTLSDIFHLAKWFMILGVIGWLTGVFQVALWTIAAHRQSHRIRTLYTRAILTQEIPFYDAHDSGTLTARVAGDVDLIHAGIGDKLGTLLMYTTNFLASLAVAFAYGWKLALVVLAAMPALVLSGAIFAHVTAVAAAGGQGAYAKAGGVADEVLGLIRTVAAFGGEEEAAERYERELRGSYGFAVTKARLMGIAMGTMMLVIFATFALSFWYGARLVRRGEMEPGDVVTVFFSIVMGAMSIGQGGPALSALATARGAAPVVFEVIRRESKVSALSSEGTIPDHVQGTIEFKDVDFAYAGRKDKLVLDHMNLRIQSGETLALVGASGCGKSTTAQMIERFYEPAEGHVTLDGVELADLNLRWLRFQIGYVSQVPTLFAASIKQNIAFGAPVERVGEGRYALRQREVSMREIEAAAIIANAHNFIMKLPEGYDTIVGRRGCTLSGGQKQRIAIARAIVRDPRILLFDEATSALDSASERVVQNALEKAAIGRTTMLIAHRLSTVRNADKIAVLHEGKIAEVGSHHELMAIANGRYKTLVNLQAIEAAQVVEAVPDDIVDVDGVSKVEFDESVQDSQEVRKTNKDKKFRPTEEVLIPDKGVVLRAMWFNSDELPMILVGLLGSIGVGASWPLLGLVFAESTFTLTGRKSDSGEVSKWCLVFVGMGAISFIAHYMQFAFLGQTGEKLTLKLRSNCFRSLLRQQMGFFDELKNSTGVLTTLLNTDAALVKGVTGDLLGTVSQIVVSIATGIIVAATGCWRVALAIVAVFPLVGGAAVFQMKMMIGFEADGKAKFAEAGSVASEAVGNIRTVQSLGLEDYFVEEYDHKLSVPMRKGRRSAWLNGIAFGFSRFSKFSLYSLTFWYGSELVRNGDCDFLGLLKAVTGMALGAFSLGQISALAPDIAAAQVATTKIFRVLDRDSEIDPTGSYGLKVDKVQGKLELDNVRFSYPARPGVNVLQGLSVAVEPGQMLALVGESGCGKSTLVSLMERFYNIDNGRICLDGKDIKELNTRSYRSHISLVSQEPDLFNIPIRDNIAYGVVEEGRVHATDDHIVKAAKAANAHNFIKELPQGYDTLVGERGGQLSLGQRQRIAIARAIIREPRVLLLDEATSALDSLSEEVVRQALDKAREGRTTIVIAHRLSTIRTADRIALLECGKVVEQGTHSELIETRGRYASLVENQTES